MSDESGNAGAGGGDDLSGLSGFFFYVFIVHPATAWILKPGRFERKKSIMYAIGFLALLASVKTGELMNEICLYILHFVAEWNPSYTHCLCIYITVLKNHYRNGDASKGS